MTTTPARLPLSRMIAAALASAFLSGAAMAGQTGTGASLATGTPGISASGTALAAPEFALAPEAPEAREEHATVPVLELQPAPRSKEAEKPAATPRPADDPIAAIEQGPTRYVAPGSD